ncbi:GNAT family N-acetyltransferase [Paenibacillus koleovorans]|uniref:GNAT family N-acetyltransferase n=1 Tax=Paenibacillus koleovorans TaxID=121608 RepID=UPI0013E38EA3|nr:GNAT family N-acetyltransferase [Paenibacillus koleovorans]
MNRFQIHVAKSPEEMARISSFFLSPESFDDTHHTPGEIEHFQKRPLQSLEDEHSYYWYVQDEAGGVIAVISFLQNDHRTGGYILEYVVVHREYRKAGLASQILDDMIQFISSIKGRYIETFTCDLEEYASIRRLFDRKGFARVGVQPDYYFPGEGKLLYYKMLQPPQIPEKGEAEAHI